MSAETRPTPPTDPYTGDRMPYRRGTDPVMAAIWADAADPARGCPATWVGGIPCERTDDHGDDAHRGVMFGKPVTFSASDPARECLCPLVHTSTTGLDYCRNVTAPGRGYCEACTDCEPAPVFIAPMDVIPATEIVDGDYVVLPVDPRSIDDERDGSTVILIDHIREMRRGGVIASGWSLLTGDRTTAVFEYHDRVWVAYDRDTLGPVESM